MKENLLKIYELMRDNDISRENIYSRFGAWLGDVNFMYLPFASAPDDVPDDYDYKEEIKHLNHIFSIFGFSEVDSQDIEAIGRGEGFMLLHFLFKVRKNTGLAKTYYVSFSLMRIEDDFVYIHCDDVDAHRMTYREMMLNSHYFDPETANETEKYHFAELLKFSEVAYETLQKQIQPTDPISDEEAFDELLSLLNHDDYLSQEDITELKTDWQNIHQNREAFAQRLIDEGIWFEEDLEYVDTYETDYLMYWAFVEKFNVYRDDWKFDPEALGDFISENIGQKFEITFEECGNDSRIVSDKLEQESDYTLLDLTSGNDDCNFIIAKKQDKQRIYTLADQLGLWVD
ncbi:DUF6630 family protein [Capnocytophaga cynodegmi]|uniref:DUF6630 family protein n=1 Tax=Capnocytophaga cynodegmi TaxID=28189 RepID=UPI0038589EC3